MHPMHRCSSCTARNRLALQAFKPWCERFARRLQGNLENNWGQENRKTHYVTFSNQAYNYDTCDTTGHCTRVWCIMRRLEKTLSLSFIKVDSICFPLPLPLNAVFHTLHNNDMLKHFPMKRSAPWYLSCRPRSRLEAMCLLHNQTYLNMTHAWPMLDTMVV